jgi:hypothetical protein
MDEHRPPALRASDVDRERTADGLRQAAADGRLTMEELDERLTSAYAARTRDELAELTADVIVPGDEAVTAPERRLPVRPGEGGTRWLFSVMGGVDRKGRWRVAEHLRLVNFMGGSEIDLNDAELSAQHTDVLVFSLMGGSTLWVPEGLNVEVSEFAFMGGNGVDLRDSRSDPEGPLLRVRLISIMGGTDIKRGRKRSRAERRHAKALERAHRPRD